jgi:protein involved in polysaccharide export with SLBB domain
VRVEEQRDLFVAVSGAVKAPDRYRLRQGMTLKDLILQAEGFTENAYLRQAEVTRQVVDRDGDTRAVTLSVALVPPGREGDVSFGVVSPRDTSADALGEAARFQLRHRDRVFIRTDPAFIPQETVTVRGEVAFPGEYTLLRDNERLSDVLERAGGILPTGYLKGGRLVRDSQQVIIEMERAVRRRDARSDVILRPGDAIIVPTQPNTVAVRGNVANEGLIKFQPGRRVSYYLDRAGGTLDDTKDVFLTQASGATFEIEPGWFRRTPTVDDGATIRVTREPPKEESDDDVDVQQTIATVTGLLTTALTLIVLSERAFN